MKIALLSFTNHEGNHQVHKGKNHGWTAVSVARALLPSKLANPPIPPIRVCLLEESPRTPQKRPKKKQDIFLSLPLQGRYCRANQPLPSGPSPSLFTHSLTHQEPSLVLRPEAPLRGQEVKRDVDEKQEIFISSPTSLSHQMNESTIESLLEKPQLNTKTESAKIYK